MPKVGQEKLDQKSLTKVRMWSEFRLVVKLISIKMEVTRTVK